MESNVKEIINILKNKDNFVIATHVHPDGDTLGSAFALCRALQNNDKNARVVHSGDFPEKFKFLLKNVKIQKDFEPDVVICVDFSSRKMFGGLEFEKIDICIDHHISDEIFSDFMYINENAAANTENIYKILLEMNSEIDENIAECLYTGIAMDTGRFKFSNVTSMTFEIASKLVTKIKNFEELNRILFDNIDKNLMSFKAEIIQSAQYYFNDKMVLITADLCRINKFKIKYEEIEYITSIPLKIKGIDVGVILKESKPEIWRVSVRTSGKLSAFELCAAFGGGGHKNAAGFEIYGNLNEIKEKILKKISILYNKLSIFKIISVKFPKKH